MRYLLMAVSILLAILLAYGWSQHNQLKTTKNLLKETNEELARVVRLRKIEASAEVAAVQKENETKVVYKTITRKVTQYVKVNASNACVVDDEWVRIYNSAAKGKLESSGDTDAASRAAGSN